MPSPAPLPVPDTALQAPWRGALKAQLGGSALAAALIYVMPELLRPVLLAALVQGAACAIVAHALRAPSWWQGIHLLFLPAVVLASALNWSPWVWLAAFALSLAVFWRTDRSRVPLYLSNRPTTAALAALIPSGPCFVLDLGCGDGSLLRQLSRARPDCAFVGVEHAPLSWAVARLVNLDRDNVEVRYGDFWRQPLTPFDLVYAFLSPVPMADLWRKVGQEMRPGTLLVSNSFAVPELRAAREIVVGDRRDTRLLVYPVPDPNPRPMQ